MREAIVVAADNTASRIDEYTYIADPQYGGGRAGDYVAFLLRPSSARVAALPAHRRRPRLRPRLVPRRPSRVLCGVDVARRRRRLHESVDVVGQSRLLAQLEATAPPAPRPVVYLDSGDTDGDSEIWPDTIAVRDKMEALGWTLGEDLYHYVDQGGCHSEAYWGARLALPLRALLPGSGAVASGAQSAS